MQSDGVPVNDGRSVTAMWASEKQYYNLGKIQDTCTLNAEGTWRVHAHTVRACLSLAAR